MNINPRLEVGDMGQIQDTLSLTREAIRADRIERETFQNQWQPLVAGFYYSDKRLNVVASQRGNAVLAAWRSYDENSTYEENGNECIDWFGRKVDGPLWLCIGIDKATGPLRPPVSNIPARIASSTDVRSPSGTLTEAANNFAIVQASNAIRLSGRVPVRNTDNNDTERSRNLQQMRIITQRPFPPSPPPTFEIPLGVTVVKEILKQWVSADPAKNVHKPLMTWNIEQRNSNGCRQLESRDKKKRVKLYSRRKVICTAFFHAVYFMSLAEYEAKFTSITAKGKVRENTVKSSAYIKEIGLHDILKHQDLWIALVNETLQRPEIRSALE